MHRPAARVDLVRARRRRGTRRGSARNRGSIRRRSSRVPSGLSQAMSLAVAVHARGPRKKCRRRKTGCSRRSVDARARTKASSAARLVASSSRSSEIGVVLAVGVVVAAAACGRSRRRRRASARPAKAAASRAGCATGARAARASPGSSVGPSTPQFHDRLLSLPSRLSSPLASLCLCVVADEVAQREAVVRGDEVDARVRRPAAAPVQIRRAGEAAREFADQPAVASPVRAHRVAVLVVPLRPARRKVADLVAAFAEVPRLGDQLDARQHRILAERRRRTRRGGRRHAARARARRRGRSGSRRRASPSPSSAASP